MKPLDPQVSLAPRFVASFLLLLFVVSACGDSETTGANNPAAPIPTISVLSVTPNLSLYRTYKNAQVQVTFDEEINPNTVTPQSFFMTEGLDAQGTRAQGNREVKGDTVTFTPLNPLRYGTQYKIWITNDVRSTEGHPFGEIFPEVTYGNTEVPAPGDIFTVNMSDDFDDQTIGNAYPLMSYLPPLLWLDPEETDPNKPEEIPGIHATEAWKLSTGRPDVLIVVIDNGLESYAPEDLVNNLYLNPGELPLPRDEEGNGICDLGPCQDPYDFNQDGRFNIEDYQAAGYAIGVNGNLGPLEDFNENEEIDPEDLMMAYMDGLDGYPADPDTPVDTGGKIDDISGYDFFRETPWALGMPEFPEGVHGEDRAREAAAEADNGSGIPGACPNCTIMVCRITYALISEGELISHAIRYAMDKGADVIVAALGSLSGTATEVAALEAADKAGVTMIVGMSDESSFHHSTPSMFNHVISVKSNYAFFLESFCTCYGGQVHVATNGQCGSTACGVAAGAAGIIVSRARDLGYCKTSRPEDPECTREDLTGNEVKQLLSLTAEKPSDEEFCIGFLTQAPCKLDTWDQHQGYGRVNLFRAVKRLDTEPLPPAVQILEPGWFALLNPALPSTRFLKSTVQARAAVDHITCEWAPGIEPDEADFLSFDCALEAAGTLEGTLPLDLMAASVGGYTHTPDDPEGKTVTVRVRAFLGEDAYGEDRRVFAVHSDPTWLEGFPFSLIDLNGDEYEDISSEGENAPSTEASPALADLDLDGTDELILATSNGQLHVIRYAADKGTPQEMPGYPILFRRSDETIRDGLAAAPAVGDLDRDGYPDIVVSTLGGFLYAFRGFDAMPLAGKKGIILQADKPENLSPEIFGAGNSFFGSPVLVDLNQDGYLDVVAGCSDQKVYAVDGLSIAQGQPTRLAGWPVLPEDPEGCVELATSILGTVAATDLTGDGIPEIIVGTSETCHDPKPAYGRLYALRPEGNLHPQGPYLTGFPVPIPPNPLGIEIPLPPLTTGLPGSPVTARMGDEVVIGTGSMLGFHCLVHVTPATGAVSVENLISLSFGAAGSGAFHRHQGSSLAYAIPAVTIGPGGEHGFVGFVHQVDMFFPEILSLPAATYPSEDYQFMSNPSFVDVDGDGLSELILVSGGHFVHAYDFQGNEPEGWPKFTYGWHMASPAFGDLDGDGLLEMVAPIREGRVFAWRTEAPLCGVHPWMTFHHDNHRTGNLETPFREDICAR